MFNVTLAGCTMSDTISNQSFLRSEPYGSLRDLNRLKRVFNSMNVSLQEFAEQEFEEPSALSQQDMTLGQQRSLLETASNVRSTDLESILMKFELWLEDYSQSDEHILSPESAAIISSIHEDLRELARTSR